MRKIIPNQAALVLALAFSSAPGWALEAIFPVEGKGGLVQGYNPRRRGEENLRSFGGELELSLFPIVGARGSHWRFTPSYVVEYSGVNNVLQVDEELFLFTQQLTQTLNVGGAWRKDRYRRINFGAFYTGFNGKLAADEPWFKGLYDYRDVGLEASWRDAWGRSKSLSSTLGLRVTDRAYPNYWTLAEPQIREKDAVIIKPWLDLDWSIRPQVHLSVGYALQSVAYKEALVVDESGTTAAATKRRDLLHLFKLGLPFKVGRQDWLLGYEVEIRGSNYSHFDNNNFVYTAAYNDYAEHRFNLSWAYSFERPWLWGWLKAPQIALDGRVTLRNYMGRLARDENGLPTSNKQQDSSYYLSLVFNSPLSDHWSGYLSVDTSLYRSNDLDESTTLNNYSFNTLRLGGQFAY